MIEIFVTFFAIKPRSIRSEIEGLFLIKKLKLLILLNILILLSKLSINILINFPK